MPKVTLQPDSLEELEKHPEFVKNWIKGLRSGKYTQIRESMVEPDIPNSACCLMVAEIEDGRKWEDHYRICDDPDVDEIVAEVPSDFKSENFWIEGLEASSTNTLLNHTPDSWNDSLRLTFNQIADLLEFGELDY